MIPPPGVTVVVSSAGDCHAMTTFSPSRFSTRAGFTATLISLPLVLRKRPFFENQCLAHRWIEGARRHHAAVFRIGQGQHAVEGDLGGQCRLQRFAVDQDFRNQIPVLFEDGAPLVHPSLRNVEEPGFGDHSLGLIHLDLHHHFATLHAQNHRGRAIFQIVGNASIALPDPEFPGSRCTWQADCGDRRDERDREIGKRA